MEFSILTLRVVLGMGRAAGGGSKAKIICSFLRERTRRRVLAKKLDSARWKMFHENFNAVTVRGITVPSCTVARLGGRIQQSFSVLFPVVRYRFSWLSRWRWGPSPLERGPLAIIRPFRGGGFCWRSERRAD